MASDVWKMKTSPWPHPETTELEELDRETCEVLLAAGTVGRLAYVADGYPVVTPVSYVYAGGLIIIRTQAGDRADNAPLSAVGFEIDAYDPEARLGWSVLVRGVANDVSEAAGELYDAVRSIDTGTARPGPNNVVLTVTPKHVTGRRLVRRPVPYTTVQVTLR